MITLSGGVCCSRRPSRTCCRTAQVKLNSVAEALTQQDPDSKMVVEGHTDSQERNELLTKGPCLGAPRFETARRLLPCRAASRPTA